MFFRSIRFKIILLYMLMSTATLSLFSVILYKNFSDSLFSNLDSLLKLKAAGIVSSIEAYWEAERSEITRAAPKTNIHSKIDSENFLRVADKWIRDKSAEPDLVDLVVHIYDAQGRIVASSKELSDAATMRPSIFEYVLLGTPRFDNFDVRTREGHEDSFRALTTPVIENGRVAYIVQVASSLGDSRGELINLKTILFILVPTTVLVTAIAGSLLVKVTLRPVDDMVRAIRDIKADNLKTRLTIPNSNDEIMRLAETYNEMLDRIENAFISQKRFNQDVSHELKTPLTVLKGELEVTLKKNRSPQEYAEVLKSNLEEIEKIRMILDNLLLLARFDNREIPFETQRIDLGEMLEKVVSHLKILSDQKSVEIRYLPNGQVSLEGNEMQLRRLFTNLVENAIKYTPKNGRVEVKLNQDNGLAVAEISDTGIGIPDNEVPFIFDRFYRVDKARSSEGFGLGLSISKSIAEAHQGDIKVKSRLGNGTTFTVFLPMGHLS